MFDWISDALGRIGARLLEMSGTRCIVLDDESCGILLHPGGPELVPVASADAGTWRHDTTLANILVGTALAVVVRDHERDLSLSDALWAAGAELGVSEEAVDEAVQGLTGRSILAELGLKAELAENGPQSDNADPLHAWNFDGRVG